LDKFGVIKKEAMKMLKSAKGSHDWEHTERVCGLAFHIAEKEDADIKVVKYAAVLHDIARYQEDRSGGKIDHAAQGAKMAKKLLAARGFDAVFIKAVCGCIATHRYRGSLKPESLEAKVLFDADKLDSIGAVGIGRAFLFAGEVGARLHNGKNVDIEKTKPYSQEDTAYREFMVKLRHVRDRMQTREGKKLAKVRHEFMVKFFDRLNKEIDGIL
jgi:uncharacterized protein